MCLMVEVERFRLLLWRCLRFVGDAENVLKVELDRGQDVLAVGIMF